MSNKRKKQILLIEAAVVLVLLIVLAVVLVMGSGKDAKPAVDTVEETEIPPVEEEPVTPRRRTAKSRRSWSAP